MLKRRQFLIAGSLLGLSPYVEAKGIRKFDKRLSALKNTIASVQAHMFPRGSKLPSAEEMHVVEFVFETITHASYDKDIRLFVIEGAEELIKREKNSFISMSHEEKEQALRAYEKTNYGSSWLSRIMTLTMEGLFSDPIYGANKNEIGWKSIQAYGGQPRPTVKYLDI